MKTLEDCVIECGLDVGLAPCTECPFLVNVLMVPVKAESRKPSSEAMRLIFAAFPGTKAVGVA